MKRIDDLIQRTYSLQASLDTLKRDPSAKNAVLAANIIYSMLTVATGLIRDLGANNGR